MSIEMYTVQLAKAFRSTFNDRFNHGVSNASGVVRPSHPPSLGFKPKAHVSIKPFCVSDHIQIVICPDIFFRHGKRWHE